MNTLLKSAVLIALCSHGAQADVLRCELRTMGGKLTSTETRSLIIRKDVFPAEAILTQSSRRAKYKCYQELSFDYECYGHHEQPYSAPTQLNISSTNAGAIVVASTISVPFLQSYAKQGFDFTDFKKRRIAMDTYIVNRCD